MIRHRARSGRRLAYCGVVACVLIAALWVVSLRWRISTEENGAGAGLANGHVRLPWSYPMKQHRQLSPSWSVRGRPAVRWSGVLRPYRVFTSYSDLSRSITIALYIPFLAIGIPTALYFIRNRRRFPPGHCQKCGYDLTGNLSGVCPECATPVPPGTV